MTALQRLKDAGLLVAALDETERKAGRYIIAKPSSADAVPDLDPAYFSTPAGPVITEDAACRLYAHDQHWILEVWECAPGPSEDDFRCTFPVLDPAIDAILAFYFGTPVRIGDWLFPLHRHPEVGREQLIWALANTVNVTQEMFAGIAERRWNKVKDRWPINRWERALRYQFLTIPHIHDPTQTLRLRRDGQEAYIVHSGTGEHLAEGDTP